MVTNPFWVMSSIVLNVTVIPTGGVNE
jgi:hypothetical protein